MAYQTTTELFAEITVASREAAEWGEASLLRLVFMVPSLLGFADTAFEEAASDTFHPEWGLLPQRGEVGRWWSVLKAIGENFNDPARLEFLIVFFAKHHEDCQSPTYKPLFKSVGE